MQTSIYSSLQLAATVEVPSTDFVCLQSGRHHASKGDTMVHKNVSVPLLVELWSRCCAPRNMSSQIYDQSSCVSDISSLCTAGSDFFTVTHTLRQSLLPLSFSQLEVQYGSGILLTSLIYAVMLLIILSLFPGGDLFP